MASSGYRVKKQPTGLYRAFWKCDNTCTSAQRNGHCKEHSRTGFVKHADAIEYAKAQHIDALSHGHTPKNQKAPTVAEAAQHWLDGRLGVRASTKKQNESYVRSLIVPYLGLRRIDSITIPTQKKWVGTLAAEGTKPATIAKAHRILHQILVTAAEDGLMRDDQLPKRLRSTQLPQINEDEIHPLTYDQLMTLADVVKPQYRIAILLGGLAGLRFGEMAGLPATALQIKADGPWLSITQQLDRDGKIAPPKTKASKAPIAIDDLLRAELAKHMKLYPASHLGTLVTAPMGGPLNHGNFRRSVWNPAMQRMAELDPTWEHHSFHDLRHTYASLLISQGLHPKNIQAQLRHKDLRMTMDRYGHLMDGYAGGVRAALAQLTQGNHLTLVNDPAREAVA